MGRRKEKPKLAIEDATIERLLRAAEEAGGKADAWDYVNPAKIDSHNAIGLVRRFRASHLDRLYRRDDPASALTFRQWYAGDWYRTIHARAGFSMSVVGGYGERVSGCEPAYGMPRTERQADARMQWREARQTFRGGWAYLMDAFLLHDFIPGYASTRAGKRGRERFVLEIGFELDSLADYLKLVREPKAA